MSKRNTPVFLTQKEYEELLEKTAPNSDAPAVRPADFKPVGRINHAKAKRSEPSKNKELL
jgi:hypothetical protein